MNWTLRDPDLCTAEGCSAKAEIERLKAQVVLLREALEVCFDNERDDFWEVAKKALEQTK